MRDNAQRPDRAVSADARPGEISSDKRDEELARLFRSLFEATCIARGQALAGDFSGIREHLKLRRHILDRVHELMPDEGEDRLSVNTQLKGQLRAMLQSTQEENLRILQLIDERKKNVLGKIVDVQNRRHVFDYLR